MVEPRWVESLAEARPPKAGRDATGRPIQKGKLAARAYPPQLSVEHDEDTLSGVVHVGGRNPHAPQRAPNAIMVVVDQDPHPFGAREGRRYNQLAAMAHREND